ncbi:DUF3718 domain-containing protein [Aliikangiella sp. IMCC44653]
MTIRTTLNKTLKGALFASLTIATLNYSPVTQANDLQRLAESLCEAAKTDDRSGMRKKLRSAKIRLRNIYAGINCGSGSLLRTATTAGSMEAATFIATKIGSDNISSPESDGKNIIQWTEGLVSAGDASKQAFLDLFNSKL